jgi:hypothetical protein
LRVGDGERAERRKEVQVEENDGGYGSKEGFRKTPLRGDAEDNQKECKSSGGWIDAGGAAGECDQAQPRKTDGVTED